MMPQSLTACPILGQRGGKLTHVNSSKLVTGLLVTWIERKRKATYTRFAFGVLGGWKWDCLVQWPELHSHDSPRHLFSNINVESHESWIQKKYWTNIPYLIYIKTFKKQVLRNIFHDKLSLKQNTAYFQI